jgi:putative FmdB family regulatory protein
MPTYAYDCPRCGGFDEDRPLAEYDLPAACPGCGQESPRALTLPQFATMDGVRRVAAATNERSANAPRSTRSHGGGCACCAPRQGAAIKGSGTSRPWMISH